MGSTELAANLFRATQAEEKLRRDNVKSKQKLMKLTSRSAGKLGKQSRARRDNARESARTGKSIKQLESAAKKLDKNRRSL